MRLRTIGACAVAVLAAAGLSACDTKAGAAAIVDGHRISQSDVNRYVDPSFVLRTASDPSKQQEAPRVIVLNTLIESRLMQRVLQSSGGVPSDSQLDALHDEALAFQYSLQQTGNDADESLRTALGKSGIRKGFLSPFLRQVELTQAVIEKINAKQPSDIAAAVDKLKIQVSVNGRYGAWSTKDATLEAAAHPDFLTLGSATPAPTPATG